MFKNFFMGIAAMAALTLVSCSSDDLNSLSGTPSKNEAISFDSYLGRSAVSVNGSRGSVLDMDALKKPTEGFGVFGNYKEAEGLEYGSNWFNNVQVTYSSSPEPAKWTYEHTMYWLPQGHIDFLAYAPYEEGKTLTTSSIEFTVANKAADQKDLLWANAADMTKDKISSTNNKVKFKFAHALSRLGYTVKTSLTDASTTITLKKITLAGSATEPTKTAFYTKGTIDLSKANNATDLWTPSDTKQNFTWFDESQNVTSTSVPNSDANYLFVIPQNFSASATDKLYVIVEYTIEGYKGVKTPMTNTVYKQVEKNFEQGQAYTINLTLGLTPIEFDVTTVEGWNDINQNDINAWN